MATTATRALDLDYKLLAIDCSLDHIATLKTIEAKIQGKGISNNAKHREDKEDEVKFESLTQYVIYP
ncbi:hypothetical protein A0J61_06064 [Choanephora cucurbitarum]|uniref:Uncharacterized protein n=1 Tax=Choanephora cucurbitarum TaxID=101091 RepID=A0A1C7NB68_9FUNG|nr:hypothetical protein A0J61_06064 [Choanephora cucurbitarum]